LASSFLVALDYFRRLGHDNHRRLFKLYVWEEKKSKASWGAETVDYEKIATGVVQKMTAADLHRMRRRHAQQFALPAALPLVATPSPHRRPAPLPPRPNHPPLPRPQHHRRPSAMEILRTNCGSRAVRKRSRFHLRLPISSRDRSLSDFSASPPPWRTYRTAPCARSSQALSAPI
jgi:hypothetical protein